MQRSQYVAALVLILAVGGLVVGWSRTRTSGEAASTAGSATVDDGTDVSDDPAGGTDDRGISGGEQAESDGGSTDPAPVEVEEQVVVEEPPPVLPDKPALRDIDGWINTDATSLDDFAGQVRVVEFWTFGCFNCKNRIPHTQELYAEFGDDGLEIIGIHSPEFERERDPVAVAEATERLGVTWPVALDTDKTNFRSWQGARRFWPRVYVLDQEGRLRYDHIGEGDYDGLHDVVAHLLENGP